MKKRGNSDSIAVRTTRKIYLPVYLMIIFLIGFLFWLYYSGRPVTLFSIGLVIFFVIFSIKFTEIHRLTSKYEITPQTFIHTKGLFNKNKRRIDLLAVSTADVVQNLWQRILNYGDVNIRLFSADTTSKVEDINNPEKFAKFLEDKILELRKENDALKSRTL